MINDEGQPLGYLLEEALDHAESRSGFGGSVRKCQSTGLQNHGLREIPLQAKQEIAGCTKKPNGDSREGNRLRPKTEAHDLQTKIKHIKKFLEQQDKVKISMMFRAGRLPSPRLAELMDQIKAALADECVMDQEPRLEGRNMIMIVAPKNKKTGMKKR